MKRFSSILLFLFGLLLPGVLPASDDFFSVFSLPSGAFEVEGTVSAVSAVPNPEKNDYPNCLCGVELELENFGMAEVPPEQSIALFLPILSNKKILKDRILTPGDKIRVRIFDYDRMPEALQQVQVSDDRVDMDLPRYYGSLFRKIDGFSPDLRLNRTFARFTRHRVEVKPLPKNEAAVRMRRERIAKDLADVNAAIEAHGGLPAWRKSYLARVDKVKNNADALRGKWFGGSFFSTGEPFMGHLSGARLELFIAHLSQYRDYLAKYNIDLILVPIPSRQMVSLDLFAGDRGDIRNPYRETWRKALLEHDIEVADLLPSVLNRRMDFPLMFFYHIANEGHPFEGMSLCAADELAGRLSRYQADFAPFLRPGLCTMQARLKSNLPRDFYPAGNTESFNPLEKLDFVSVLDEKGKVLPHSASVSSPILFLGNSFSAYPSMADGASIPDYTSLRLKTPSAWLYRDGAGTAMLRELIVTPGLLDGRRVVLFVMQEGHFNSPLPALPDVTHDAEYELLNVQPLSDSGKHVEAASADFVLFDAAGTVSFPAVPQDRAERLALRLSIAAHSYAELSLVQDGQVRDAVSLAPDLKQSAVLLSLPNNGKPFELRLAVTAKHPLSVRRISLYRVISGQ